MRLNPNLEKQYCVSTIPQEYINIHPSFSYQEIWGVSLFFCLSVSPLARTHAHAQFFSKSMQLSYIRHLLWFTRAGVQADPAFK